MLAMNTEQRHASEALKDKVADDRGHRQAEDRDTSESGHVESRKLQPARTDRLPGIVSSPQRTENPFVEALCFAVQHEADEHEADERQRDQRQRGPQDR